MTKRGDFFGLFFRFQPRGEVDGVVGPWEENKYFIISTPVILFWLSQKNKTAPHRHPQPMHLTAESNIFTFIPDLPNHDQLIPEVIGDVNSPRRYKSFINLTFHRNLQEYSTHTRRSICPFSRNVKMGMNYVLEWDRAVLAAMVFEWVEAALPLCLKEAQPVP